MSPTSQRRPSRGSQSLCVTPEKERGRAAGISLGSLSKAPALAMRRASTGWFKGPPRSATAPALGRL
eukprot:10823951-Lingulodinium_polyedra.AAC.1